MLEAGEELKIFCIFVLVFSFGVSHSWLPKILIEQGDVLLYGGREITVIGHIASHALAVVVVNLVQDDVDSFLKVAFGLAVQFI